MEFKKYIKLTSLILVILSIILFVFSLLIWSSNQYAGFLYLIIAVVEFLGAIFVFPRIAGLEDMKEAGNRAVQQNWIVLSIGIAGMALFLAPFFRADSMTVPYIAFIICVVSVLLSAFNIYTAIKKVKARMVV